MRCALYFLWLCCIACAQAPMPQPKSLTAQDVAAGKRLFEAQCAPCHGMQGTGGKGPSLARATLTHAADDAALFSVIREGIDNTEMRNFWQMTDREVWLVVAYVRSLGRVPLENLPGDPVHGKALFATEGCSGCHIVNGVGGNLGPELSTVGARRSSQRLRQCLLEPGEATPEGFMVVRVTLSDGSAFEGLRVNEDSFTVQLRDYSGQFHSLRKQQLARFEYMPGSTPMPSYHDKLSPENLDDLVAYLATLRAQP